MAATTDHRLQQLEAVEREISTALQCAGQALAELGRDKPANKQLEAHTSQFLKTLENTEGNLSKHIMYLTQVSTSQPHEGSSYAAQKNLQMAQHRLEHIRSCVNELDRVKADHLRGRQQQQVIHRAAMAQVQNEAASHQRTQEMGQQQQGGPRGYALQDDRGQGGMQRGYAQDQH